MSAFVKVYTDNTHTNEVAHTTQNTTTVPAGGFTAGETALTFGAGTIANWPTSGTFDFSDGANSESIVYYGKSGDTVNVGNTGGLAHAHAAGIAVNQWYYQLAVGDQANGIPNDGTNATPDASNTGTWYLYNSGDQTAQALQVATAAGAPSTTSGFADTVVSDTSATTGFAASITVGDLAAAAVKEIWVAAEIPNGQSIAGNPQICQLNLTYSSI